MFFFKKKTRQQDRLKLAGALNAFLEAGNPAAARKIIEANPDLYLTDYPDKLLVTMIQLHDGDPDSIRILENFRTILRQCRSQGIAAVFDSLT